jgi:hypothetical protein
MILYSLFNFILLWLTSGQQQEVLPTSRSVFRSVASWCGVPAAILSIFLVFVTLGSLYERPPETSAVVAAILGLLVVAIMSDKVGASFFRRPVFLLMILTFVVLYMSYSVYLVQPNLMHVPVFSGLDPYGDWANAVRILSLSRFEPGKMLFEQYYRTFPVVPLEIATVAMVTGLPANIGYLIVGVAFQLLGVSCAVLLSWVIMGKRRHAQLPAAALLPALVVLANPQLIDPTFFELTPLGFGVFLLLLVMYLAFRSIDSDPRWSSSAYISIVLIALVIVPMHAAPIAMMIILFTAMALSMKRRSVFRGFVLIAMVCFLLYVVSYSGSPATLFADMFVYVNSEYLAITRAQQIGVSNILNVIAASKSGFQWDEVSSFLASVPPAFLLAIASTLILRLVEGRDRIKERFTMPSVQAKSICDNLSSFCLFCGLFFIVAFGGAYALDLLGGIFVRYVIYSLTPIILLATTIILVVKLRNINTGRRILLLGLLAFYVISVATSSYFLLETSPVGARVISTQSESAAVSFLSAKLQIATASPHVGIQIVADYPFAADVQGVLFSNHFYEGHVVIPDLISAPIEPYGYQTFIFARQYFIQDPHLQRWTSSPYELPLADSQNWMSFNRIFDDSSTCIYSGAFY